MFNVLKGTSGERTFRGATVSVLAVLTLFIIGIIISMLAYTNWDTFLAALFSEEILFAIRLSVITATVSAIFSIGIAIPVAYFLIARKAVGAVKKVLTPYSWITRQKAPASGVRTGLPS